MTEVQRLAQFVANTHFEDLPGEVVEQLKVRILDSLAVAIGALDAPPMVRVRNHVEEMGGAHLATLIGGGMSAPDRAAFYNGALIRYLDFMDSYLAPGETFHPSDNIGAVLAAAEYANASGTELLTALAIAYEVQARLSEAAPVRARGFDHTTQGAYAAAAGVAKALRLDGGQTANAIAMSGTANNALRVTRTGSLSHWKGLAYPNTAASAVHLAFLAMHGITGPAEVFEGAKGFKEVIAGPFEVDWESKSYLGVTHSVTKKYDAEVHAQSALEAVLELREKHHLSGRDIESVDVEIFQVAYDIIGGGHDGAKVDVSTKEDADHSLPYLLAVALLDGQVYPQQYAPERITALDVQELLSFVRIKPDTELTRRFPREMPVRVRISLYGGTQFVMEKSDFDGFYSRPAKWATIARKLKRLSVPVANEGAIELLETLVKHLEKNNVRDLTGVLSLLRTMPEAGAMP